jgi:ubiquinone biosynthesis protein
MDFAGWKLTVRALSDQVRTGWDAAAAGPRLGWVALRQGVLPAGWSALETLRREGPTALHWKVLGDGLVRFFRHGGPLPTKLGQILAAREDLLPPTVCRRLAALYSQQEPMPRAEVQRLLRRHYGQQSPFVRFSNKPIAVGSIGQVHRARLRDGSRVVVKLVRPHVEQDIRRDMNAARMGAEVVLRMARAPRLTRERLRHALTSLGEALEREANLEHEAAALLEFRKRLARNRRVRVPVCHRELCSSDILVLEELSGVPLSALRDCDDDDGRRLAAYTALREILSQVFEDGRYHADPHGGNLLWLEDGRLGLIDLGLTGELDSADRTHLARAVRAFLSRDLDGATRALLAFGSTPPDFDLEAFKREAAHLFQGAQADDRADRLERLVNDLLRVAHAHGIYLPTSTTLLIKTLVTIEGVARSLDPEINVVLAALPVVLRSVRPRWMRWSAWRD